MKAFLKAALFVVISAGVSVLPAQAQSSGSVVGWGYNMHGQANVPTGLKGVIAIAAGSEHSVVLKSDGKVLAWGNDDRGQTKVPAGLSGITAIAAGYYHTVALKNNGKVVAWGNNNRGQTKVPTGLSDIIAVAAGLEHTVALKSNGTVVAWGYDWFGATSVPAGLNGVIAIAAGANYTLALKSDGAVVAWGNNNHGQTDVPAGLNGVIAIAAGSDHAVALQGNGDVVVWGHESQRTNVPAGLSGVVAITAGGWHTVALKDDGALVAWGEYYQHFPLPRQAMDVMPSGLTGVTSIASGRHHTLAISDPIPRPQPSDQIELYYHETSSAFQFVINDEGTDDKIIVTTGKKKGGFATQVKRVDYYFGSSPHALVPAGIKVGFFPNQNGLPARIIGLSHQATTAFIWKSDLSSVKITTGLRARRGTQRMPSYMKSMVNGDFLGADTVSAAALNGRLASWLAEVVDTTSTWAYAAAEVSVDGFGEEGVYPDIAMDQRYQAWQPLAHYACRFIGGLRPDQVFGASGFFAIPQSDARESSLAGGESCCPGELAGPEKPASAGGMSWAAMPSPESVALQAADSSPIPSFRPFGTWNFRGAIVGFQTDYQNAIVSFLRALNTKTFADDGPIRNRILDESLMHQTNPSDTDVDRGRLVLQWLRDGFIERERIHGREGKKLDFEVWREGGTAGFLAAEVLLGATSEVYPDTVAATYGSDFSVRGRVFRFKSGQGNALDRPQRGSVSLFKDKQNESSESFRLHLKDFFDGGQVLSSLWGIIGDEQSNPTLVYYGRLSTDSATITNACNGSSVGATVGGSNNGLVTVRHNAISDTYTVEMSWSMTSSLGTLIWSGSSVPLTLSPSGTLSTVINGNTSGTTHANIVLTKQASSPWFSGTVEVDSVWQHSCGAGNVRTGTAQTSHNVIFDVE